MARPRTRRTCRYNLLPDRKDEIAGRLPGAPTKNNNIPTPFLAIFWAQTPASALASTLHSNKRLFQKFIKAYLENQNQNQTSHPTLIHAQLWKQSLKAQFPKLYYKYFYLDCYRFCQ